MIEKAPAVNMPTITRPNSIGSTIIRTLHQLVVQKLNTPGVVETIAQHTSKLVVKYKIQIIMQEQGAQKLKTQIINRRIRKMHLHTKRSCARAGGRFYNLA